MLINYSPPPPRSLDAAIWGSDRSVLFEGPRPDKLDEHDLTSVEYVSWNRSLLGTYPDPDYNDEPPCITSEELKFLSKLPELKGLDLPDHKLTDITFLNELNQLTRLKLPVNQITDLSPLKALKQLKYLDLRANQITDLSPLKELKNLEILLLSGNQLTDTTHLQSLKQLWRLSLANNALTDISPLVYHPKLRWLDITGTQLKRSQVSSIKWSIYDMRLIYFILKNDLGFPEDEIGELLKLSPLEKLNRLMPVVSEGNEQQLTVELWGDGSNVYVRSDFKSNP